MTKKTEAQAHLFNIPFFSRSKFELLKQVADQIEHSSKPTYIFTPNPEQVVQAKHNRELQEAFVESDYNIPDGIGVVLAAKFLHLFGKADLIQQRISGRELVEDLLDLSAQKQFRILLIGGKGYQQLLKKSKYDLTWTKGYADALKPTEQEEKEVTKLLQTQKPDIVFVAFGAPQQELWALAHREQLKNAKIVMVVGGSFDYLLGKVPSCPQFIAKIGLEWLFRLITQPWRWRRQLRLVTFVGLVIREVFTQKR